jgi:hypothetical protein
MKTLDEVFNKDDSDKADEPVTDIVPSSPDNEPDEASKVEDPKPEPPKGEQAAPPVAKHEDQMVPLSALKALRKELQELKQEKQEKPTAPDVLADPEGFEKHIQTRLDQQILDRTVAMSEDYAKRANPDFAEVMGTDEDGSHTAWVELAKANPHLVQQFRASPNPALFAYEQVKRHKAMSEIGDPLTYRERIEAQIRAKVEADLKAKEVARPAIPDTLADEPSKSPRKGPEWTGPKPLNEILGKK